METNTTTIPYRDALALRTSRGAPTGLKAEKEEQAEVPGAGMPAELIEPDGRDWLLPANPALPAAVSDESRQEHILRLAEVKLEDEKTAARFKEEDYLDRVRLFVRAGHPQALRLCACSFSGEWGGYPQVRRCNISNLCPYCSSVRHEAALLANTAAYHSAGETAFLTLKFHGKSSRGHAASAEAITDLWTIATEAIRYAIKHGYFTGALVSRELAVASLMPLRVMAHIHATIVAPQLNLDSLNHVLMDAMTEVDGAKATFSGLHIMPMVHIGKLHRHDGDMVRGIRYSMKPFGGSPGSKKPSLPDLYRSERTHHEPYMVNDSVRQLVSLFHRSTYRKHRTTCLGVLSHMAKASLKVPKVKQLRRKNVEMVKIAKVKARNSAEWDEIHRMEDGL